jgi:hypothetical protein
LPYDRESFKAEIFGSFLYVIGGTSGPSLNATGSVIRLDLSNPTGAWDDAGVTDLPYAVCDHTANIYESFVYVAGGAASDVYSSVIRLDLSNPTSAWDDAGVADLPETRTSHGAAIIGTYLSFLQKCMQGFE